MPGDRPIKVLWLIKGLGPGGSERLLVTVAAQHDRAVVELTCAYILSNKDHLVEALEQQSVHCTCLAGSIWKPWPVRLRRLLRDNRYDIVHMHSPLPGAIARLLTLTLRAHRRPKLITTEHNAQVTYAWPVQVLNCLTRGMDDASIAVSNEARGSLGRRARSRTQVLLHGIDLDQTRALADRSALRSELGVSETELVICTVANFRIQKDYPNLLRAAALLRDRGTHFRWLIVGQGPREHEVRQLANSLALDEIVTFLGYRPDAPRVMSGCDVFVLASAWEGMPVAIMEALALGVPIVATNVGGLAEVLTSEQDALLVAPGEPLALAQAVQQLLSDPTLRRRLAREGQTLSSIFDAQRAAREVETIYSRLIPRRASPTPQPSPKRVTHQASTEFEIRPAQASDQTQLLGLLRNSLGWGDDPRNVAFFVWKHQLNPFGASPMWVAAVDGEIVGLRAFLQWRFTRAGQELRAARAVDTAVDARFRQQGLFTRLTMHGLAELRAQGFDFIFNTPNPQSTPGYLALDWQDIGRLPIAVLPRLQHSMQLVTARTPAERWSAPNEVGVPVSTWLDAGGLRRFASGNETEPRVLVTAVDEPFIRWRYGQDVVPYRVVENDEGAIIMRTRQRGTSMELVVAHSFASQATGDRLMAETLRQLDCSHALRFGPASIRRGIVGLPTGPRLLWRDLNTTGAPPFAHWLLSLGDIELM